MTKFYGLTGGIGSGKSTVCSMFNALGVPSLDLDQVGKLLLTQDKQLQQQLIQTFGVEICNASGTIEPKKLAALAFLTQQSTQQLNATMHPAIQRYEVLWRRQQTSSYAIIEASVLIESKGTSRMDGLIVVFANLSLRKSRVLSRGKQNESIFESIIQQQCSDGQRKALADYIIHNNDSLTNLQLQVSELHKQLSNN
ncbi:MAG: dephospho-CoA kinase [Zetaproteobacteria bacterium CG2_30_46_52]|nr:MAG: dephospho-CoA kinase [Zetaproteobacteria bacterium CG2_30_46_52]